MTQSLDDLIATARSKTQAAHQAQQEADAALAELERVLGAADDVARLRQVAQLLPESFHNRLWGLADQLECRNVRPTDFASYKQGDRVQVDACALGDPRAKALLGKETHVIADLGDMGVRIRALDGQGIVFDRSDIAPARSQAD